MHQALLHGCAQPLVLPTLPRLAVAALLPAESVPTYSVHTAACNTGPYDPASNTQLWQFRSDPFNSARYLLTPWGPDPSGGEPQCATTCFTTADTGCTSNSRISAYAGTAQARRVFTEVCDQVQSYGFDGFDDGEALTLLPGACLDVGAGKQAR
jgi:hypothetical protein